MKLIARLCALLVVCLPVVTAAQPVLTGITPTGASYSIRVPPNWQPGGGLVMVNHGYSFDFDNSVSPGPLVDLQLAQGYAVIASGFRVRGWALGVAADDNWALYQQFVAQFGVPGELFAVGGSMGGLISLKQAEDPRFRPLVDGVYALCPPALGSASWEFGFDLKLGYDAICRGVGGGEFSRGSAPYSWALDLAQIPEDLGDLALDGPLVRALARIQQCTGLLGPSFLRTPPQRDRLADLKRFSGITNEDFLILNLGYAVFAMADLLRGPDQLAGANPFDNLGLDYTAGRGEFNNPNLQAQIERAAREPLATLALRASSDVRGAIDAPVVSLHTSGDQLVLAEHQSWLRQVLEPQKLLSAIVSEVQPTHCNFNRAELVAGWETLRSAAGGAPLADAQALQQRCEALVSSGAEPGPCRIAPRYKIDPIGVNLGQRAQIPGWRSPGIWQAPGALDGALDTVLLSEVSARADQRSARGEARLGWHGWLRDHPSGALIERWAVADAQVYGNGYSVPALARPLAGRFGTPSTAADTQAFAQLAFWIEPAPGATPAVNAALARLDGLADLGLRARTQRYSQRVINGPGQPLAGLPAPADAASLAPYAASAEFADGFGGRIWLLLGDAPGAPPGSRAWLEWWTFDPQGAQVRLYGSASGTISGAWTFAVRQARSDAAAGRAWGEVQIETSACAGAARVTYAALDPTWGGGIIGAQKTRRAFAANCPAPDASASVTSKAAPARAPPPGGLANPGNQRLPALH